MASGPGRIGLFGGTFDPVHFGHLRSAVELAETYELDRLHLLPNHRPVHRGPARVSTAQRITMLQLATKAAPRLVVDPREALRETPSYSYHTIKEVKAEHPETTLIFFMGLDAFSQFDTWHNWQGILQLCNLVVVPRPGACHSLFSAKLIETQGQAAGKKIKNTYTGVIEQCEVTQLQISATRIRRLIGANLNVQFLLPETVTEYIRSEALYQA